MKRSGGLEVKAQGEKTHSFNTQLYCTIATPFNHKVLPGFCLEVSAGKNRNKTGCQRYFLPQHLQPFFTARNGPEGHSLRMQATASPSQSEPLAHSKHLCPVRGEGHHVLLLSQIWKEVEADEVTFEKGTVSFRELAEHHDKPVLWEQWGAIVQRGAPETLVLAKLNPAMTVPRAPDPGAIRKVDWKPLALKHTANRNITFHMNSARSYRNKLPGVVHDAAVHKKRVKKNGK